MRKVKLVVSEGDLKRMEEGKKAIEPSVREPDWTALIISLDRKYFLIAIGTWDTSVIPIKYEFDSKQ